MTMAEYLPYALAGEMPASFEPEALKAQAVALRTYALYGQGHRKERHPGADVCTLA
ncbi:MAG: SpoIID/LytB domain-containing protein, partial [Oscillospiraceae bacterium]|nr:SpoIID/LytB domain-containing protein [Oscillospiraceae bacterium]